MQRQRAPKQSHSLLCAHVRIIPQDHSTMVPAKITVKINGSRSRGRCVLSNMLHNTTHQQHIWHGTRATTMRAVCRPMHNNNERRRISMRAWQRPVGWVYPKIGSTSRWLVFFFLLVVVHRKGRSRMLCMFSGLHQVADDIYPRCRRDSEPRWHKRLSQRTRRSPGCCVCQVGRPPYDLGRAARGAYFLLW